MGVNKTNMNSYHIDMKSRMGERGQVTIPKAMRDRLGLRPGEEVAFEEQEDCLILRKTDYPDALDALRGLVPWRGSVDEYLAGTRGPEWNPELDGAE